MLMSRGSFSIFIERPVSLALIALAALVFVAMLLPMVRRKAKVAMDDEMQ